METSRPRHQNNVRLETETLTPTGGAHPHLSFPFLHLFDGIAKHGAGHFMRMLAQELPKQVHRHTLSHLTQHPCASGRADDAGESRHSADTTTEHPSARSSTNRRCLCAASTDRGCQQDCQVPCLKVFSSQVQSQKQPVTQYLMHRQIH